LYYHKGCVIHDNQNNGTLHSGPLNIWTPNMDPLFYSTTLLIALYPKIDVEYGPTMGSHGKSWGNHGAQSRNLAKQQSAALYAIEQSHNLATQQSRNLATQQSCNLARNTTHRRTYFTI
jgi:hypothetical protein